MGLQEILDELEREPAASRCITHWARLAPQPAREAPIPATLDPRLARALRAQGIERLYSHQAAAYEAASRGENVVVVTPTASGKTLCYNLPVLDRLQGEPGARALYLFPTKALAQDQRHALETLVGAAGLSISVEVYDGDTPTSARRAIRAGADIVITNPDMLHTGILPHHTRWLSLWSHLRYIVIDEVHGYRGLFGSHFANLLRRLRRIARFYQCDPQIIAASATIANPQEHFERLIDADRPAVLVDESGAPQGERHFIFWNPPPINERLQLRRSSLLETRRVAARFLARGVQTIVFTRSRLSTEVLLRYLQEEGERAGLAEGALRGYRGGYLPLERREIEQGLRDGTVRGVVSTNALELGVDIGELDACVMHGYPGTIASTWQQAGRVGRRHGASAALLVASAAPLDQYIVRHPEWFFAASPEHARINPDNLPILVNHLRCAAFELPFEAEEGFGSVPPPTVAEVLAFLAEAGDVHTAAGRTYWTAESYPAEGLSLRTAGSNGLLITEQPGGRVIGEVDRMAVHQMCHPGAIYMHEGRQYLVDALDWDEGRADARPVEVEYYTRVESRTSVTILEELGLGGPRNAHWGDLLITSVATGFKKIRLNTHENLGRTALDLPESRMHTTGYWLGFPIEVGPAGHDYGPNWKQQRLRARGREGFRCAACRISEEELGRELDVHHVIPFREFGYVAGENDGYLAANDLGNLEALCPTCHGGREPWYRSEAALGLAGVANAIGNIAPLFLMCDPRDLAVTTELRSPDTGRPTLFIYDRVPSGVGFAEALYELHDELLRVSGELIRDCPCEDGCPACIGPDAIGGGGSKQHALAFLESLGGEG